MKKAVFLCTCENTLSETLDYQELMKASSELKGVDHVEVHPYLCSREGLDTLKARMGDIDGLIIAGCSPRKYNDLFEKNLADKLNGGLILEQAAIREQAAWVHRNGSETATNVAKILIDVADASLSLSEPSLPMTVSLEKRALVIGGGVAGMQAALDLADSGIPVDLVERKEVLGGRAQALAKTYPTSSCGICCIESCFDCILTPKPADIFAHPGITTYLHSEVKDIQGNFGNYKATIEVKNGKEVISEAGIVFLATGSKVFDPSKVPQYNSSHPDVITSQELSEVLITQRGQGKLTRPSDGAIPRVINFVLCVGSRAENPSLGNSHCSIVCCNFAVGQAKTIKQMHPEMEVYIHFIDLRAPYRGFEDLYKETRRLGVIFIRGRVTEVREMPGTGLQVLAKDSDLGKTLQINSDLVVLYVGQEPSRGTEELSTMLHKSLDSDGFFKELNLRLKGPNRIQSRTYEPGTFVIGCAQGPRGIRYSVADARAAVSSAVQLFRKKEVSIGKTKAFVEEKKCDGCAYCIDPCPFNAITLIETDSGKLVEIDHTYCEGCGVCQATCPKEGVNVRNFSQAQIRAKVNRALSYSSFNPRILAFLCNWCGFPAADLAGVNRASYYPIVPIRVMCSGMVHTNVVMDAFTRGADGVMILGCQMDDCHYIDGNKKTDQRREAIELLMTDFGLEPERFRVEWVAGRQWRKFSRIINEFHDVLEELGPSPFA